MMGTGAPDITATASSQDTAPSDRTTRTGTNQREGTEANTRPADATKPDAPTTPKRQTPKVWSNHAGVTGSSPEEADASDPDPRPPPPRQPTAATAQLLVCRWK